MTAPRVCTRTPERETGGPNKTARPTTASNARRNCAAVMPRNPTGGAP